MKSYSQAIKILLKNKIAFKSEYIDSSKSFNRVSAENIHTKTFHPSANNSSFDGFAINYMDTKNLSSKKGKFFKILGTIAAGDKIKFRKIKKFQTCQIMTGGLIPKNFNAVLPIEKIIFFPNKKKTKVYFY